MIIGKRAKCPYCLSGTIRADHLDKHLRDVHGLGYIEADEINDRFNEAVSEMSLDQALVYACFGIHVSWIEAKFFILEYRQSIQPYRCLCCKRQTQARYMVHKSSGQPGSICKACRTRYFSFQLPRQVESLPRGIYAS